jgi:hypothetical protein
MRTMPGLASLLVVTAIAAGSNGPEAMVRAHRRETARLIAVCPHLDQLASVVRHSAHRLVARRLGGSEIVLLFEHLSIDLPARFAHADAALVVYDAAGRGQAIIVLFLRGCALAALRLPVAAAIGALRQVIGQEI